MKRNTWTYFESMSNLIPTKTDAGKMDTASNAAIAYA